MKIYNSLTKKIEDFRPISPPSVTFYSCGPTVYDYAHIGHMRKYVGDDLLVKSLKYLGFSPKLVMNITDVGHLVSDADEGEDKMEKGSKKHGLDVWGLAKKFERQFFASTDQLNIERPNIVAKATDHIEEQIHLIKSLEAKGFTYQIDDGIYYDTSKFESYGQLSSLNKDEIKEGARVEVNSQKRNPTDFALWKFNKSGKKREMEWDSPWGSGFPGWHIECSAMSMKYLGEQFDIHTGGVDHKEIHHPNEIAQSEAATGKVPFVRFWIHHEFLMINGQKMSKSLGNLFTVKDIVEKNLDPLSLRYLFLTAHYRKRLNFTWEALESSQIALDKLRSFYQGLDRKVRTSLSTEKLNKVNQFSQSFKEALESDLNFPQALAISWEVVKSNIPSPDKKDLLKSFDQVLGLNLEKTISQDLSVPPEIEVLIQKRNRLRDEKKFKQSDQMRQQIEDRGYEVKDSPQGTRAKKIK
jgi:cysteinyl-tRNA synthetase